MVWHRTLKACHTDIVEHTTRNMMPTILITGASRGLGLEFARQYAADGWHVIATCRDPQSAHALNALAGPVAIHPLDVRDERSIKELACRLADTSLDILLLNAGVHLQKRGTLAELDAGIWLEELKVNTIAPLMIARSFVDHVARSNQKRIVAISSGLGSIARIKTGGDYAYRSGKAALNAVMRMLAADVAQRGITIVAISPGHTRTDMGGENAPYSAAESVTTVRATIAGLQFKDSGGFFSHDGVPIPW